MTETNFFIDSSAWLGYLLGNMPETKAIIESQENTLFTSILTIYEVYKKIKKLGKEPQKAILFIEENSIVINITKETVLKAVENSEKYSLHTVDSFIYTGAEETNSILVTADNDFDKLPSTKILRERLK
ncbi:MAG: PIN domain-containing protein [archaeon]|jgi:predicted nucleic acid-binding protein